MTLAVGVDLGGTNLRAALVDTLARGAGLPLPKAEMKVPLNGITDPETVAQRIAELVITVTHDAGPAAERAPVGIGVAGMLRGDTGIVANAPNLGWREVDFRSMVSARLPGHHVDLANDVNAIAFGEYAFGSGRGAKDILCVFVGTGIGAGLVAEGRLIRGASHAAGEIGHTKVVMGPHARPCGCGARGCIEAYAGGHNLQDRARAELRMGARSHAVALAGGNPELVHPGHLDRAAIEGDEYASNLWDEIAPLLGNVLANAVTLLNPGRLILGGGVWIGAPELARRTLRAYETMVNAASAEACTIVDATLGDLAGILGAAMIVTVA